MSGHADTIRLRHFVNNAALFNDSPATRGQAIEALDALMAQNQRYEKALEQIATAYERVPPSLRVVVDYAREALAGDTE